MSVSEKVVLELTAIAHQLRVAIIEMIFQAQSGHCGGSLSACEILTALYYKELKVNPGDPQDPNRDRFILSKGHAAPALYGTLARKGYFPEEELSTLRKIGSRLQGHPDSRKLPGIEISTGSLGMGISFGIGAALAAKMEKRKYRVYVLTGCGELDEGQNWEAFMTGFKYGLDNMVVIVDYNKIQLDGPNDDVMPLVNLEEKLGAFNWNVISCNGHDFIELIDSLEKSRQTHGVPSVIVAHTIKGKGVSFMENTHEWHGKQLSEDDYRKAMSELKAAAV